MAIVDIEVVIGEGDDACLKPEQTRSIADALGRVFETGPNRTWVKIRYLPSQQYAHNEAPQGVVALPVFVSILKNRPPAPDQMSGQVAAIARELAPIVGRPTTSIHVLYEASARGRLGIGGVLNDG